MTLYTIRSYSMIRHTIGSSIWTEGVSAVSTTCKPSIKRKYVEGERGEENCVKKKKITGASFLPSFKGRSLYGLNWISAPPAFRVNLKPFIYRHTNWNGIPTIRIHFQSFGEYGGESYTILRFLNTVTIENDEIIPKFLNVVTIENDKIIYDTIV